MKMENRKMVGGRLWTYMESDIFLLLLHSSSYVHSPQGLAAVRATRTSHCSRHTTPLEREGKNKNTCLFFFFPTRNADDNPVSKSCLGIRNSWLPRPRSRSPKVTTPPLKDEAEGTEMNTRVSEREGTIPIHGYKMGLRSGVCFNCARESFVLSVCKSPLRIIAATAFLYHHWAR